MVQLSDVVDALTMGDPFQSFYDKECDEVVWISDDDLALADDERDDPALFADYELAIRIADDDGTSFIPLPSQWEVHEYSIMQDFAQDLPESEAKDRILYDLRGSGAFRRFRDNVHRLFLADAWYTFRDERLSKIARQWADENDVPVSLPTVYHVTATRTERLWMLQCEEEPGATGEAAQLGQAATHIGEALVAITETARDSFHWKST